MVDSIIATGSSDRVGAIYRCADAPTHNSFDGRDVYSESDLFEPIAFSLSLSLNSLWKRIEYMYDRYNFRPPAIRDDLSRETRHGGSMATLTSAVFSLSRTNNHERPYPTKIRSGIDPIVLRERSSRGGRDIGSSFATAASCATRSAYLSASSRAVEHCRKCAHH